jgi:hypothetical protein
MDQAKFDAILNKVAAIPHPHADKPELNAFSGAARVLSDAAREHGTNEQRSFAMDHLLGLAQDCDLQGMTALAADLVLLSERVELDETDPA